MDSRSVVSARSSDLSLARELGQSEVLPAITKVMSYFPIQLSKWISLGRAESFLDLIRKSEVKPNQY